MNEPRKVEVAFADGRWLAEVSPDFDEPFGCESLRKLIEAVQRGWPGETLLFIVDQSTIDGYVDAEAQLLEASEKSGALVVSSTEL